MSHNPARKFRSRIGLCLALAGLPLASCTTAMEAAPTSTAPMAAPTVYIASDSTVADYKPDRYPQSGWGSFIGCALDGVSVDNRAVGGRSTRSFVNEDRWNSIRTSLKPGDTVLIQFAHNDANKEKAERYVAPDTAYRQYLVSFIADARAAGATPILVTPVTRHNFKDGHAVADFAAYSAVMRDLAGQYDVPLVDLESASRQYIDAMGEDASNSLYLHYKPGEYPAFPDGIDDDTHFSELGARRMANLVADGLAQTDTALGSHVSADRSDLTRATAVGSKACH